MHAELIPVLRIRQYRSTSQSRRGESCKPTLLVVNYWITTLTNWLVSDLMPVTANVVPICAKLD